MSENTELSPHFSVCAWCGLPIGEEAWVFKILIEDGHVVVAPVHVRDLNG